MKEVVLFESGKKKEKIWVFWEAEPSMGRAKLAGNLWFLVSLDK